MDREIKINPFKFCPHCKSDKIQVKGQIEYQCKECSWVFFHNVAAAAGILFYRDNELLLIKRGHEPGKGLYDVPGGFLDTHESAEEAAIRECYEELGIKPDKLDFFVSYPNQYLYKNILYNTCDLYFISRLEKANFTLNPHEVAEALFVKNEKIDFDQFAFSSTAELIRDFMSRKIN